ncbi:hypothetical protein GCM10011380_31110 [Sphingomonas metalli]|uniref:Inner membrane protein n=1 Tax=Sphingomonas metalli TaxID=1779358 RepID=A0A916TD06_9SPHN|nr:hypothetical protein [Sphingomonas metalli]GGB39392.1 hypothetical protein GCM10011380_31110 [Sphingomonas metalli]
MSSLPPLHSPQPQRRWGAMLLMLLLAFAIGGLAVGYAMRAGFDLGLGSTSEARKGATGDAAAEGFVPAQPLGANGQAPAVDPTALVTREAALAGQLTALEARTAAVASDAAAAGTQAARAEALMVAFAARRAIDRGTGLGYLEEQLRTRFVAAQPRAVAVVIQAAHQPVTIEDLRQGLDAIAPTLQSGAGADWLTQLRREVGNLIVLRKEGTPSTAPVDRLARARRLLDDGQVEAARQEVARLPGAAQAGAWMAAARRYALAHQALDVIETAAILGQAAALPAPARAPAAPEAQTQTQTQTEPASAPAAPAAPVPEASTTLALGPLDISFARVPYARAILAGLPVLLHPDRLFRQN